MVLLILGTYKQEKKNAWYGTTDTWYLQTRKGKMCPNPAATKWLSW